jgi:hypothetical protein
MKRRGNDSLLLLVISVPLLFLLLEFRSIVNFFAIHLKIDPSRSLWLVIFLLVVFLFLLPTIINALLNRYKSIEEFLKDRERCIHGIRKGDMRLCEACAAEKAIRDAKWKTETERQEFKKKLFAESRALRSAEIERLSKHWLATSDSYFSMGPFVFEDAIARLFGALGYEVKQTPYSNDGGKDAILRKDGKKYVVECKRYDRGRTTGRRDLQVLLAAMHDEGADGAFFVTTGQFARTAIEYARENDIKIYDGDHLPILINQAFTSDSPLPKALVMCERCGEVVHFDIFSGILSDQVCSKLHVVICNLKLSDLTVATTLGIPVCPNHRLPMLLVEKRWGKFWACPRYPRCGAKIPLNRLAGGAKLGDEKKSPTEVMNQQETAGEEINCITLAMSRQWNIWAPIFKDSEKPIMSLAIPCGTTAPGRDEYCERLFEYLDALILANPQQAKEAMRCFSTFQNILGPSPSQEWAYHISHCDEMNMLLNEVDWERINPPRKVGQEEELPGLGDILEMI